MNIFNFDHIRGLSAEIRPVWQRYVVLGIAILTIVFASTHLLRATFYLPSSQYHAVNALDGDVVNLVIGTSHAQYGVDPREFSEKTVVLSAGFLDYVSMERLWTIHGEKLVGLKRVILEIGAGSIYLNRMAANEITPQELIDLNLHAAVPWYDKLLAFDQTVRRWLRPHLLWRFSPKTLSERGSIGEDFTKGAAYPGFDPVPGTSPVSDVVKKGKSKIDWVMAQTSAEVQAENRQSLLRLVRSIDDRGIEIILLRYPLHPEALSVVPDSWVLDVDRARDEINAALQRSVPIINLLQSPQLTNESFRDADHLNESGAKVFSRLVRERL